MKFVSSRYFCFLFEKNLCSTFAKSIFEIKILFAIVKYLFLDMEFSGMDFPIPIIQTFLFAILGMLDAFHFNSILNRKKYKASRENLDQATLYAPPNLYLNCLSLCLEGPHSF